MPVDSLEVFHFWVLMCFMTPGMFSEKNKFGPLRFCSYLRNRSSEHFMTMDEYHHHCIAFDLGYLYLSDLRRSNPGQIGKNHSKWLITLVLHFRIKITKSQWTKFFFSENIPGVLKHILTRR